MSRQWIVHAAGPGLTLQDQGRPGYLPVGLSRGGAIDQLALFEGAALLRQDVSMPAIEMAGMGGTFEATADVRIALTGAPMQATVNDQRLEWHASHHLPRGSLLKIGAVKAGNYGYLHTGGGLDVPLQLGARSTHLGAGIGAPLTAGDQIAIGEDQGPEFAGARLRIEERFHGGEVRMVPSLQTHFFAEDERKRFEATTFQRDMRGNRMGVRFVPDGEAFRSDAGLSVLSEVIIPGDVQISGDGTPFVLLAECQTTGGYPRIGSVIPSDIPRIAQAQPGCAMHFRFITLEEAVTIEQNEAIRRQALASTCEAMRRNPHDIPDLLAYQLISGVTAGDNPERTKS